MGKGNIKVGRKDVFWTYAAVFLQIGNNIILLPFILRTFSQETVGIWIIFSTIIGLTGLLDFGFNTSFARNVSYIFSGAITLQKTGYCLVKNTSEIDYSLLKGLINAMRWFYSRMAFVFFLILTTVGTYYIYTVLKNYSGNPQEIYLSWIILVIITSYSFYTLYYDALLLGKGLIKRNKQIAIISQTVYLIVAIALIILQFNLIAIVCAKALSAFIMRILSYRAIYTADFKNQLTEIIPQSYQKIMKFIYPNAVRIGLTSLGGFLVNQLAILIGPLYLPLGEMASYGITMQIIGIITALANVYYCAYQPQIVQHRLQGNMNSIKHLYLNGVLLSLLIFIVGGLILLCLGDLALTWIGSQTSLSPNFFVIIALLICFLEANHTNAAGIILTRNEVPFFRASLFSGIATTVLLFLFFQYTFIGVWSTILARGIVQGIYQNWKWPLEVVRELKIRNQDILNMSFR